METIRSEGLYEADFARWADEQAELLRTGQLYKLDLTNLSEEIESLSRSDRREIFNRLAKVFMHLIKFRIQPEKASRSWLSTIIEQMTQLHVLLNESPSLGAHLAESIPVAFASGMLLATAETGIPDPRSPFLETEIIKEFHTLSADPKHLAVLEHKIQIVEMEKQNMRGRAYRRFRRSPSPETPST